MGSLAAWRLALIACTAPAPLFAAAAPLGPPIEISRLDAAVPNAAQESVLSGSLDAHFDPMAPARLPGRGTQWLRIRFDARFAPPGIAALVVHAARQTHSQLFLADHPGVGVGAGAGAGAGIALARAATLAGFRGTQDAVFIMPGDVPAGQSVYARVEVRGGDSDSVSFEASTLDNVLARGAEHARMIALAVGALLAVALAALLIWFVLSDKLFILYSALFFLQALYVAYLSGQGFDWPLLSYAAPLASFAWNVPIGLSGAVGCLFVREIADLRHFSPRVDAAFGWFAAAFVLVTIANLAKLAGFGVLVNGAGNLIFLAAAIFTVVTAFFAWRRGNRAAGWFLIAWGLLEGFTIAAAVRFLFTASVDADPTLYYYGLPLSMVAAAVLVALGVADRLREQRLALTDAERRAQIDSLTGVLNRRSLIERLDAACLRAIIDPIHAELRQSDVIGRYGGEEFVVILSSADAAAARPIAERILERVANVRVEGFGEPIGLTCSIGIAASDTLGVWGERLLAEADAAVYEAKRCGRNRVQMAAAVGAAALE